MGTTISRQRDMLDSVYALYGEGKLYPMYYISYEESKEFCKKLNILLSKVLPEGYKFSIPTEAQWEYAARGGRKSKGYTYSGSNDVGKVAWYETNSIKHKDKKYALDMDEPVGNTRRGGKYSGDNSILKEVVDEETSKEQTHEVGTKRENELGIADMSGNVWEWCLDWFDGNYYNYSPTTDPTGPGHGPIRAMRGGSWRSIAQACRVSCRSGSVPGSRASNCGLRVVLVRE
jgi:formylglycine-generating enzyme required for sulfatase activity